MRVTAGSLAKRIRELRNFDQYSVELDELCGIGTRPNGARFRDRSKEAVLSAQTHSFQEVGEAICGRELMQRIKDRRFHPMRGGRLLMEATETAGDGTMGPSQFQAINYWSETAAKVLEAFQLEKFTSPAFIGDRITTLRPGIVMNVGRRSRYSPPVTGTKKLQPNEPIPMGSLDAEWIDVHAVEKHGQGLAVSTEAMIFDGKQGEVVDAIGDIAYQIGWSKEDRQLQPAFGIENTYRYGAADSTGTSTALNTYYLATDNQQYANKVTVDLTDEVSLDVVEQLFLGMKNPRTNLPINMGDQRELVVMPYKLMVARRLARITSIEQGPRAAAPAAVEATSTTWAGNVIEPMFSQRAYDLMQVDNADLGWTKLTATQAKYRFIYGNPRKSFEYREARPFQSWSWNMTQDPSLALHDCFMMVVALEQGSVTVVEPRHTVLGIKDS